MTEWRWVASLYLALACRLQIRWANCAIVLHILNNKQTPSLENTANTKDRQEIKVKSVREHRCCLAEDYRPSIRVSGHSWETLGKLVVPEGDPGGLWREQLRLVQMNHSIQDSAEPRYLRYQDAYYPQLAFCLQCVACSQSCTMMSSNSYNVCDLKKKKKKTEISTPNLSIQRLATQNII